MAVVVAAFVVSTVAGSRARNVIGTDVAAIAGNAMPSVEYLARARGLARKELLAARQSVNAARGRGESPTESVDDVARELASALESYRALPYFSGEPVLFGEVSSRKEAFDRAISETLAVASGDRELLDAKVEAAIDANDRLDAALERLVDFNAAQAQRFGGSIESERHAIDSRLFLANAAVGALAMAATLVAAISWRRSLAALKERNRELDMFAGRVAHDLLSPLMAVGTGLSLTKTRVEGDGPAVAVIQRATRSLERVRSLVTDLLDFARAGASPEQGQTAEVRDGLCGVVEGAQAEAREARVEIHCEGSAAGRVACPPGVLMSLAQNLVRNAIKYMEDSPCRQVTVSSREAGPFVLVSVEDTGPGMPEQLGARVFEPFVRGTSSLPGLGIGLATVKKLAEAYGGHVGCRSAPSGGSIFWFELPRAV